MKFTFGDNVRDMITGFEGRCIGFTTYITGCNQVLLAPPVGDKGEFRESHWFDEQRCELMPGAALKLENGTNPGADQPAPKI
jgi:hypothetical protein